MSLPHPLHGSHPLAGHSDGSGLGHEANRVYQEIPEYWYAADGRERGLLFLWETELEIGHTLPWRASFRGRQGWEIGSKSQNPELSCGSSQTARRFRNVGQFIPSFCVNLSWVSLTCTKREFWQTQRVSGLTGREGLCTVPPGPSAWRRGSAGGRQESREEPPAPAEAELWWPEFPGRKEGHRIQLIRLSEKLSFLLTHPQLSDRAGISDSPTLNHLRCKGTKQERSMQEVIATICGLPLCGSFVVHFFSFILYTTCEWNHTVFVFFHLTYFIWRNTLKVYPCHKWQGFIFFMVE